MTDDDWKDWVKYHSGLFHWTTSADVETLAAWRESFEMRGYTLAELREASRVHAESGKATNWRRDQMEFVLQHVANARYETLRARRLAEDQTNAKPVCGSCGGSGYILVPMVQYVVDGRWIHPYCDTHVACVCYRGQRQLDDNMAMIAACDQSKKKGIVKPPRLWTLAEYEEKVPDWPAIMEARAKQREAERLAEGRAALVDRQAGPLRKKELMALLPKEKRALFANLPKEPPPSEAQLKREAREYLEKVTAAEAEQQCPF